MDIGFFVSLSMKHIRFVGLVVLLFIHVHLNAEVNAKVQENQIEANVPPVMLFDAYLERDLVKYFGPKISKGEIAVVYKFLRNGPTQSGASYPKYYLWVDVTADGELVESGAIRIAAVAKSYFEITNYLSGKSIRSDPESVSKVFPAALIDNIYTLAGIN